MFRRTFLLAFLLPAACGKDREPVLARVGDRAVTTAEFKREIGGAPFAGGGYLSTLAGKKELLELLIRRKVVLAEAEKAAVAAQPDLKKQLDEMEAEFIRQKNEARERLIVGQFLRDLKAGPLKVSDEDVQKAWRTEKEVRASHILVSDEAKARDIRARLDKGAGFEALAREFSEDPTGKKGGDLGFLARGSLVPSFENALFPLKVGEVAGPVNSPYGFHLIKKTGERPLTVRSLESSAGAIRAALEKQRFQAWLDEAKKRFPITTDTPALEAVSVPAPKQPTEVSP